MNKTFVPSTPIATDLLSRITDCLSDLTPELQKAATYVLENPNDVGISSIRQIADAARVKPNTFVRLAQNLGCDAYDDFRKPFREDLRAGREGFPDRARWIQTLSKQDDIKGLYSGMASASMENLEDLFAGIEAKEMREAARLILGAENTYVLGVGIANALAHNFAYTAGMAVGNITAIPRNGSLPVDDLVRAKKGDVLIAMTFSPYRREVVEAVEIARQLGIKLIAVSDSLAAPIMPDSEHKFLIPVDTPQFFTSTIALTAFLETLVAYLTAEAGGEVIENIERFHARRQELGIYVKDEK